MNAFVAIVLASLLSRPRLPNGPKPGAAEVCRRPRRLARTHRCDRRRPRRLPGSSEVALRGALRRDRTQAHDDIGGALFCCAAVSLSRDRQCLVAVGATFLFMDSQRRSSLRSPRRMLPVLGEWTRRATWLVLLGKRYRRYRRAAHWRFRALLYRQLFGDVSSGRCLGCGSLSSWCYCCPRSIRR